VSEDSIWKRPFRIDSDEPFCYRVLDAEGSTVWRFEVDDAAPDLAYLQRADFKRMVDAINATPTPAGTDGLREAQLKAYEAGVRAALHSCEVDHGFIKNLGRVVDSYVIAYAATLSAPAPAEPVEGFRELLENAQGLLWQAHIYLADGQTLNQALSEACAKAYRANEAALDSRRTL
jgi:hypothetical protein